jgi:hypothetical protein
MIADSHFFIALEVFIKGTLIAFCRIVAFLADSKQNLLLPIYQ